MELTSDAFEPNGSIPSRFTCDGQDLSPALSWRGAPLGTQSFTLIMDDRDAGGFTHWVIFNLGGADSLPEGVDTTERPPTGGFQARNDFGRIGYGGPCPPSGTHRYEFRLYALDFLTEVGPGSSKKQVQEAMEGHILGTTTLTGTYETSR